jgi:hypothetical protein
MFMFKRWRLSTVALVAALAVFAGTTSAFAAEPGESSAWSNEIVGNGARLQSHDTYSEARGEHGLVQIWRGLDDRVYLAVNNGPVFWAGESSNTTRTHVAPRVVWMDGWFYAFHTGTDGHIYWCRASDSTIGSGTPSFSQSYNWSHWTAISGNPATTQSVSVAATDNGLLMTWIGVGQTTMYSAWLQNGSDVFRPTQVITNANSNSAPVVTFNPAINQFELVFRGLFDNRVYIMAQVLGQSGWSSPQALPGITTPTSPTISADVAGNLLIAAVDDDGNIQLQAINSSRQTRGWSEETTRETTGVPLWISIVGSIFYLILTESVDDKGFVLWKPGWDADDGF